LLLGYAFIATASNSVSIWLPSFFARVSKLNVATIGFWIGIVTLLGGLPGTILGGWIADKLKAKNPGGRMLFSSIVALLSMPLWFLLLYSHNVVFQFVIVGVLLGLSLSWLGAAAADVNDIAGPHLRGLAVGLYFFIVNAIGYGIAPVIYGKLNDVSNVMQQPDFMRVTLLLSPAACLLSAIVLYISSRKFSKVSNGN
jgi:MFS family permease